MNKEQWVKSSEEAKADGGEVVLRWKHVPGYGSDYIVYDTGDIVSAKRRLLMKQTVDKKGYAYVSLCKGGKYRRFAVHRLHRFSTETGRHWGCSVCGWEDAT